MPVEIVARIVEVVYLRGCTAPPPPDIIDGPDGDAYLLTFGCVDIYGSTWWRNRDQAVERDIKAFKLWGADWSCVIDLEPQFGSSGVVKMAGISYNVVAYTMVNKRGWLRDVTVARMMLYEMVGC